MSRSITTTIRDAVNSSKESRYAISQATGIDQAALKRFAEGGDVVGATLDKLADYYGLELKPKRPKR